MQPEKRDSILDFSRAEQTTKFKFFKKKEKEQTENPVKNIINMINGLVERIEKLEEKADVLNRIEQETGELTLILPEQTVILSRNHEKELIETLLKLKINCCIKNTELDTMQIHKKTELDTSISSLEDIESKN